MSFVSAIEPLVAPWLLNKFGPSASRTYSFLRLNGRPASACLLATRRQVKCIGRDYDGALYAIPFRNARN
jgi:hypothetical protein